MSDDLGGYLVYALIALLILVFIAYYFTRFVFSMKRQLWNQKTMINLLIMIAKKNGVTTDELEVIEKWNNDPDSELK